MSDYENKNTAHKIEQCVEKIARLENEVGRLRETITGIQNAFLNRESPLFGLMPAEWLDRMDSALSSTDGSWLNEVKAKVWKEIRDWSENRPNNMQALWHMADDKSSALRSKGRQ